jgi:hypothetical protein
MNTVMSLRTAKHSGSKMSLAQWLEKLDEHSNLE